MSNFFKTIANHPKKFVVLGLTLATVSFWGLGGTVLRMTDPHDSHAHVRGFIEDAITRTFAGALVITLVFLVPLLAYQVLCLVADGVKEWATKRIALSLEDDK